MEFCSGKQKNLAAVGGDFTPQLIFVNQGEDIMKKLSSTIQEGSWRGCILSANGLVSSITVRNMGFTGTVTYEGCFDIISLRGLFTITGRDGERSGNAYTSISWSDHDNCVFGGEVAGPVVAAERIQVVVGMWTSECCEKGKERRRVHEPFISNLASDSGHEEEPSNLSKQNLEEAEAFNGEYTSPLHEYLTAAQFL